MKRPSALPSVDDIRNMKPFEDVSILEYAIAVVNYVIDRGAKNHGASLFDLGICDSLFQKLMMVQSAPYKHLIDRLGAPDDRMRADAEALKIKGEHQMNESERATVFYVNAYDAYVNLRTVKPEPVQAKQPKKTKRSARTPKPAEDKARETIQDLRVSLKQALAKASKLQAELKKSEKVIEGLRDDVNTAIKEKELLARELLKGNETEPVDERILELEAELEAKTEAVQALQARLLELSEQRPVIDNTELTEEISSLEADVAELNHALTRAQEKIRKYEEREDLTLTLNDRARDLRARVAELESQAEDNSNERFEADLKAKDTEIKTLQNEIVRLNGIVANLKAKKAPSTTENAREQGRKITIDTLFLSIDVPDYISQEFSHVVRKAGHRFKTIANELDKDETDYDKIDSSLSEARDLVRKYDADEVEKDFHNQLTNFLRVVKQLISARQKAEAGVSRLRAR